MDKSKKIYVKALDKYDNGYIDKAIDLCEESIALDIKNAASINLKGLLYYLKGDIDNAQKLWKMNYQINKDGVAERYLIDTKSDKERLIVYKEAVSFVKELYINEALELLEKCSESDYNYINVNNYKTLCYIKKGQYDKAINTIENVMKVDKNNSMAKENRKTLIKYGMLKNKIDGKKAIYCLIGAVLVITIGFAVPAIFKTIKNNIIKVSYKQKTPKKQVVKTPSSNQNKTAKEEIKKNQQEDFPRDKIKNDIQSKNFENIYENYMKWKDKNISINDKAVVVDANEILKNEGAEYFYGKGYAYINSKEFSNAEDNLTKAYNIGEQNYLYPHIIYMLGTAFYLSSDFENAIKYYTQYDEKYENGDYEETVLYALATMYKDSDKSKAASFAQKLIDKYPKSIYNNSVIKNLINQ
jgi:tetratricopeptide (TPR) repeat protein